MLVRNLCISCGSHSSVLHIFYYTYYTELTCCTADILLLKHKFMYSNVSAVSKTYDLFKTSCLFSFKNTYIRIHNTLLVCQKTGSLFNKTSKSGIISQLLVQFTVSSCFASGSMCRQIPSVSAYVIRGLTEHAKF